MISFKISYIFHLDPLENSRGGTLVGPRTHDPEVRIWSGGLIYYYYVSDMV